MVLTVGQESDPLKRIRKRQGETIRKLRVMRGMEIHELASAVGVSPGSVSHWENGRVAPRQDKQVAIARSLNVPWSTIFGLDAEACA